MISISCADYAFPLLPREQRFALLRMLGFEYVDLGLFERSDGLRPAELLVEPRKFARQLKRDLIHAGLQVSDVFLQAGSTPRDSAENDPNLMVRSRNRKTFLQTLELCAELECAHVTCLPGVLHKGTDDKDSFKLAVEEISWRLQVASNSSICYAIKPHADSICATIDGVRSLLEAVPGLTLTLDYAHFISQKISSRNVHALLPHASHIHVRGAAPNKPQVPIDKSQIDFGGMVRRLRKNKYSGSLAIEYVWDAWRQCNYTDNVSETILLRSRLTEYLRPRSGGAVPLQGRPDSSTLQYTRPQSSLQRQAY